MMQMGIIEEVAEHTDWVNSNVIVEKDVKLDSGNAHSPNHNVKKKLRIWLDPRDPNEALERKPSHTRSVDESDIQRCYHCRHQEGLLDGCTSPRFQEIDLLGTRAWEIPVNKIANG